MVRRVDEIAVTLIQEALWRHVRRESPAEWTRLFADVDAEYLDAGHPEAAEAVRLHYHEYHGYEQTAEAMHYGVRAVKTMCKKYIITAAILATERGLIHPEVLRDDQNGRGAGDPARGDGDCE